MRLTEKILKKAESRNGGYSEKQLKILNIVVRWNKGWKKKLLFEDFTEEQIKIFLELKNKHLKPITKTQQELF